MNSLVSMDEVLNDINSLIDMTMEIDQKVIEKANTSVNKVVSYQMEEIGTLSTTLRKIDHVLNETTQSNRFINRKRNQQLTLKLSY